MAWEGKILAELNREYFCVSSMTTARSSNVGMAQVSGVLGIVIH